RTGLNRLTSRRPAPILRRIPDGPLARQTQPKALIPTRSCDQTCGNSRGLSVVLLCWMRENRRTSGERSAGAPRRRRQEVRGRSHPALSRIRLPLSVISPPLAFSRLIRLILGSPFRYCALEKL